MGQKIEIPESELHYDFIRASGPGGQHVNKAATAVQLRFDVAHSPSLPEVVRQRLLALGGKQITREGVLVIESSRYRSQHRNREEARDRLARLVHAAAQPPKRRRKIKLPRSAKERRLQEKRRRSETKRRRESPGREE